MMFEIEFTPESADDLEYFKKHKQVEIVEEIEKQLLYEPTFETKKRKRLKPNEIAELGNYVITDERSKNQCCWVLKS